MRFPTAVWMCMSLEDFVWVWPSIRGSVTQMAVPNAPLLKTWNENLCLQGSGVCGNQVFTHLHACLEEFDSRESRFGGCKLAFLAMAAVRRTLELSRWGCSRRVLSSSPWSVASGTGECPSLLCMLSQILKRGRTWPTNLCAHKSVLLQLWDWICECGWCVI